jgi:hypothetical protein
MGKLVQFRCDACEYEAKVSGGPDVGMEVATQTIACARCKQLSDVVTSKNAWDPKPVRLPLRCPRSRTAVHPVAPWSVADPCPRCGGAMRDTGEVMVLWD